MEYTVVVPVYNEAGSIVELTERLYKVFSSLGKKGEFEIIFVDDGSTDTTKETLRKVSKERDYVKCIILRKNFGKSLALMAGFQRADARYIITMDGDLQDRPEDIPLFIQTIEKGYDVVSGWRTNRHEKLIRVAGSRLFNMLLSRAGAVNFHDFNCGFKIYTKKVIKNITIYGQYHRFIPLMAHFLGFKITEVKITQDKRRYGVSKYRAIRYEGFLDLLSILFLHQYQFSPFYFFAIFGLCLIFPSSLMLLFLIGKHLLYLLGFGTEYILFNRPLFTLSTTFIIMGFNIALTGFICEFLLHHIGKLKIKETVDTIIEESYGQTSQKRDI